MTTLLLVFLAVKLPAVVSLRWQKTTTEENRTFVPAKPVGTHVTLLSRFFSVPYERKSFKGQTLFFVVYVMQQNWHPKGHAVVRILYPEEADSVFSDTLLDSLLLLNKILAGAQAPANFFSRFPLDMDGEA